MKNRILFLLAVICFTFAANVSAAEKNAKPFVIPELREWKGATGEFTITKETKIVYPKNNAEIAEVAKQFACDYKKMTGVELQVVEGKSSKGDIVFSVKKNKKLGNEGYTIKIANKIEIAAATARASMWATRTLLQIAEQNNGNTLPKGNIVDYPDYAMRSFMLDCGRKFIPISFLHEYVDFMAYYKMNTFHIHLNDNAFKQYFNHDWAKTPSGFRLESDFFPGLTSRDGYYTKAEFIELQKHAERMGVEIIPEFDVPAHSLAFVHYRPELGSKDYGLDHLDLFNPNTYTFIDSLFMEYLSGDEPVFRGPRFHVGTDEYSNRDTAVVEKFRYFTDFCIRAAEKYGLEMVFRPFIKVESVTTKEFRQQKVSILDHTAVVFTSRHAIDHFFQLCAELRVNIPETMKYFCITETIALYIQKYVQYRKRKVFFGHTGKLEDLAASITKHKNEKYFVPLSDVHTDEIKNMIENGDYSLVTPEFKETMDSYEAFCDDYVQFMKDYQSGDMDFTKMLENYKKMLAF